MDEKIADMHFSLAQRLIRKRLKCFKTEYGRERNRDRLIIDKSPLLIINHRRCGRSKKLLVIDRHTRSISPVSFYLFECRGSTNS